MSVPTASTVELLEDGRALIARGDFCKGALARDAFGNMLDSARDPRACTFCATGALCHVAGADDYHQLISGEAITGLAGKRAMELLEAAARQETGRRSVADVNDEYGQGMAVGLFDDAIAAARTEEAMA